MKSTTPTLSLLLGVLATTVLAQEVAPVTVETVTVAPLTGDDGSAVVDQFPVPVEMAKRDVANQSLVQRFTSSLTKRHYGVFTCSYSLNNYCKQFLGQEGVGNLVGCDGGVCYVGCGVSGYTRTNDVNDICVNYNTDITNCGSNDNVCPTTANGSPVCNSGQCSITCATGFTLSAGKCVNTGTDINNCGGAGKVCPAVANGTPVCNAGTCSATCTAPFTLSGGKCINTSTDPSNCGTAGKVCPAVTNGTPTCSAGSCSATCAPGYTLANGACTNTNTDVNNCGGPGKTCPAVANGTPVCNAGSCSATCAAGYTLSAGKCINTTNDVNNCGGAGKTCPAVTNGTPVCNAGTCGATCATGYSSTDGKTCNLTCKDGSVLVNGKCGRITGCTTNADCVAQTGSATSYCYLSSDGNACFAGSTNAAGSPSGSACGYSSNLAGDDNGCATGLVCLNHVCTATTTNDPNNCGRTGNVCPTPTNGFRTCQAGTCGITCNSGYTPSGSTCVNTAGDTSNCGAIGNKCAASGSGVASSTCVAGKCQVSCSSGYTPSADKTTCNSVCADGSYLNGLTCSRYGCSTNAQCQTQTGRTDSACFNGLCYTSSSNTVGLPAGSPCGLSPISSGDDNQCAAGLVCVYYTCYNANSPTACGASRTVCPTPANGVATCTVGTCGFTCKTGYMPNASGTGCILNPSAKPLKKKRGQAGPELCPKGESACPIVGSASFGSFVNSSDRVKDFAHSLGGYECVDTASDLQSCGGCASLGTGFDCTRIAHSSEVGCSSGKCVLLSCKKGYAPALDAEKCIKVEETSKQRSAHLRQRAMRRKDISH